jgi:DNA repair photolyase
MYGFDAVVEDPQPPNGCRSVRLRGGLRERLRFFHLTDPAITRKRDIEGVALKSDADLRVVSVEPLGRALRLYDVTTGTGDYIGNGVVHHNCFARPTHEYLEMNAAEDFDQQIVVKVNAPEVLRAELRRPSWQGEHVALGTNTDPYQWVEKRYELTRGILEVLRDARNPCSVLTKSPLLLRDLDVFLELLEVTEFSACLSIPTLDEKAWRATEPHTPHPRKRLEAVAELNAAGVPTGVLVAPLMPGINDAPEQVEEVVRECERAGAVRVGGQALFLRGATKDVFMGWLRQARPDLIPLYERLYGRRAYLREPDKRQTEARLRELTGRKPTKAELAARFQRGAALGRSGHGVAAPAPVPAGGPESGAVQGKLF